MTLQVEYSATFFPFFNSVEANEINPKLDDALSLKEENQIIIQILKSFQNQGYTQVQDSEMSEIIPIQTYIQRVQTSV